jgi:hypothetical protein
MVHIKHSAAFILAVAAAMIAPAVALPVPNQFESHSDFDHWEYAKYSRHTGTTPIVGEPLVASPFPKQLESHSVWPFSESESAGVHHKDPICLRPDCHGEHVVTPGQVADHKQSACVYK